MTLILYAVPGFFLLIFIEMLVNRARKTQVYRLNDALTSLATGTINQLVSTSKALIPFTIYVAAYEWIAVFDIGSGYLVWLLAFILYDFCYYWNHRLGHEMNILWASHVVHHSSEEYNLTTALRQTGTGFLSFVFYLPLAILGFEPEMLLTVGALNLIYQFWVHTQFVGKLGWYEWFFVTPSNHRGHHAQNSIYIDKNYGGVFILWDRLFGTYQEEDELDKPIYGIRGAVQSWNPLWVNAQIYAQLCADAWRTENWWHKLTLWFRRTGWRPPDVEAKYPLTYKDLASFVKYDTDVSLGLKVYCFCHYMLTTTVALFYSFNASTLALSESIMIVVFVLWSSFSIGALMESKQYAGVQEWLRLMVFISGLIWFSPSAIMFYAILIPIIALMPVLVQGRRQSITLAPGNMEQAAKQ